MSLSKEQISDQMLEIFIHNASEKLNMLLELKTRRDKERLGTLNTLRNKLVKKSKKTIKESGE